MAVVFGVVLASQRFIEGYLLAASIADDASNEAAAGLCDALRKEALSASARLAELPHDVRRSELRRIATQLREPPRADTELPPRALALLARDVPKDVGRIWLAAAPAPRRGFVASGALREVLRRASRRPRADASPEREAKERGAGREVLARAWKSAGEAERAALLEGLGADEASAVLALAPLVEATGTADARVEAALIRATAAAPGTSRTRVLGAMLAGATAEPGEDHHRRAGREIAELIACTM